jgi:hypothetical protein
MQLKDGRADHLVGCALCERLCVLLLRQIEHNLDIGPSFSDSPQPLFAATVDVKLRF